MKHSFSSAAQMAVAGFTLIFTSAIAHGEDRISFSPKAGADPSRVLKITREFPDKADETFPVRDIHFDIVSWEGSAAKVFTMANDPGLDPYDFKFLTYFEIVANGKTISDNDGICGGWKKDMAACLIEDDGGHFWLRRKLGSRVNEVTLILRKEPKDAKGNAGRPALFRVGEWDDASFTYLEAVNGRYAEFTFTRPAKTAK
jgi:hypothetical protein